MKIIGKILLSIIWLTVAYLQYSGHSDGIMYADPIVTPLLIAGTIYGGIRTYQAYRQQGEDAEKLAEARARADEAAAEQARAQAEEEAKIEEEKGQKLKARQRVLYAASNVRVDVGAPLVIEAQTTRDITLQKGFILERGRNVSENYRLQATYERAYGKQAKKQSNWNAVNALFETGLSAGYLGYQGGLFNTKTPFQRRALSYGNEWLS